MAGSHGDGTALDNVRRGEIETAMAGLTGARLRALFVCLIRVWERKKAKQRAAARLPPPDMVLAHAACMDHPQLAALGAETVRTILAGAVYRCIVAGETIIFRREPTHSAGIVVCLAGTVVSHARGVLLGAGEPVVPPLDCSTSAARSSWSSVGPAGAIHGSGDVGDAAQQGGGVAVGVAREIVGPAAIGAARCFAGAPSPEAVVAATACGVLFIPYSVITQALTRPVVLQMPPSTRRALVTARCRTLAQHFPLTPFLLGQSWIMRAVGPKTVAAMAARAVPRVFFPGDAIVAKGGAFPGILFLRRGAYTIAPAGDAVGAEAAVLPSTRFCVIGERSAVFGDRPAVQVTAVTLCDAWLIPSSDLAHRRVFPPAERAAATAAGAEKYQEWVRTISESPAGRAQLTALVHRALATLPYTAGLASAALAEATGALCRAAAPVVMTPHSAIGSPSEWVDAVHILAKGRATAQFVRRPKEKAAEYGPGSILGTGGIVPHRWPFSICTASMVVVWRVPLGAFAAALQQAGVLAEAISWEGATLDRIAQAHGFAVFRRGAPAVHTSGTAAPLDNPASLPVSTVAEAAARRRRQRTEGFQGSPLDGNVSYGRIADEEALGGVPSLTSQQLTQSLGRFPATDVIAGIDQPQHTGAALLGHLREWSRAHTGAMTGDWSETDEDGNVSRTESARERRPDEPAMLLIGDGGGPDATATTIPSTEPLAPFAQRVRTLSLGAEVAVTEHIRPAMYLTVETAEQMGSQSQWLAVLLAPRFAVFGFLYNSTPGPGTTRSVKRRSTSYSPASASPSRPAFTFHDSDIFDEVVDEEERPALMCGGEVMPLLHQPRFPHTYAAVCPPSVGDVFGDGDVAAPEHRFLRGGASDGGNAGGGSEGPDLIQAILQHAAISGRAGANRRHRDGAKSPSNASEDADFLQEEWGAMMRGEGIYRQGPLPPAAKPHRPSVASSAGGAKKPVFVGRLAITAPRRRHSPAEDVDWLHSPDPDPEMLRLLALGPRPTPRRRPTQAATARSARPPSVTSSAFSPAASATSAHEVTVAGSGDGSGAGVVQGPTFSEEYLYYLQRGQERQRREAAEQELQRMDACLATASSDDSGSQRSSSAVPSEVRSGAPTDGSGALHVAPRHMIPATMLVEASPRRRLNHQGGGSSVLLLPEAPPLSVATKCCPRTRRYKIKTVNCFV